MLHPRLFLSLLLGLVIGCGQTHAPNDHHDDPAEAGHHPAHEEAESWAVTAWGELYEIFPEIDPLVVGEAAAAHTHVTRLVDFAPLTEGRVEIVLRGTDGAEAVFGATVAKKPGIYGIEITPRRPGEFELLFRVDSPAGREEIEGGRVRVGPAEEPGGLILAPGRTLAAEEWAASLGGEEISFLKEQQWKTPFRTAWAEAGELQARRSAPARLVTRPGGDLVLTAPEDGTLEARPLPYPGLQVRGGTPIFALAPRRVVERSWAELEEAVERAQAELKLASSEHQRMGRLVEAQVLAISELEHADAELAVARARADAAAKDLAAAKRARGDGTKAEVFTIAAPFDGTVAEVTVGAGQTVAAGAPLARFLSGAPPWIEASLAPDFAATLTPGPTRVDLRTAAGSKPGWSDLPARLVALAPAIDATSGRRKVLLELEAWPDGLAIGQTFEVEIASAERLRGIVLPVSALIDDSGASVVYVQPGGETVLRREVRVLARAGERILVEGLGAGERVVTVGAGAIRRASLVSSGVGEAHVH